MQKLPIIELESKRLLLDPLNESHIPAMFEYSSMPEFYIHMEGLPHISEEDTKKYFIRLMTFVNEGALYWAIMKKDIHKTIGTIGIRKIDTMEKSAELGLGISPLFWNMGFAKEADFLALNYFFNTLGFLKVYSYTSEKNESALKTWKYMGYDQPTLVKGYYKKFDGTSYNAVRAELSGDNFNNNMLLKEFDKE